MKKLLLLTVAAVAAALLASACGSFQPWAARVNGDSVSQAGLNTELNTVLHNKTYLQEVDAQLAQQGAKVEGSGSGTVDTSFAARALTRRILLTLVHQELTRRHLTVSAADLASARTNVAAGFQDPRTFTSFPKSYQNEVIRQSAEVNVLEKALETGGGSDAALRAYYNAHTSDFTETCVSHILVDTQAKAAALKAQLAGGADFATLAKANSQDNQGATGGSAAQGGSLGCLSQSDEANLDPSFKAAMDALPVGQVSDPVQSQFGFHLILVTARRAQPYEQAKSDVQNALAQQAGNTFSDLLSKLVAKAKIQVDPRYGHFEKGANFGVVPPSPPSVGTTTTLPASLQPQGVPSP